MLEGKYSYVVSPHIDKNYVHNHIIFCAADNLDHNKYHDCKQTYYRIRKLSDELCAEHNLSIIKPGNERGKSYKEWQADRNGGSGKTTMRKDINDAIRHASNYDEFLMLMRAKGYEIKGEGFGEDSVKYIAFRPLDKDHFEKSAKQTLVKVERRMKDLAEIIKYAEQYKDTRPYHLRYKNAKDKDAAFRKFESKLILHDGAKHVLEQRGLNAKSLNIDRLKAEYQELLSQKSELTASYQNSVKELKSLNRKLANLKQYLGNEPLSQHEKGRATDKTPLSL